ncbi:hypothetical protein AWC11_07630 [Mycobacterium interjectum]|nr:hypothetical protein AWC11_07630 [Mycobacterium interjectum]
MLSQHSCGCARCGFENSCTHGRWVDRHPVAAVYAGVFVGLPAGYTLVGVMLVYPWFTIPAMIIVCALLLNRAARRRAAIAARADWEHRELIRRAVFGRPARRLVAGASPHAPRAAAAGAGRSQPRAPTARARHVLTEWPTTPMLTRPIRTKETHP